MKVLDVSDETEIANRVKIVVADNKSHVRLDIDAGPADGEPLVFTPDELLDLIQGLGQAHQHMVRGMEIPPLIGQRVDVVTDTRWAVGTEQMGEATIMSFQHPAYGPVSFLIPIQQAETIARRMLFQVEEAKASRQVAN